MIMTNLMLHGRRLITTSTPTSSRGGSVVSTYQRTLFSTYFSSDDNPTSSTTASDTNTITASNSTFSGVMSKGDLIKMIAEDNDMSQAQSGRIVNSIFDTIIEEVAHDKKVTISGFGYFQGIDTKERNGYNPSSGEPMTIPASRRVKFMAYKSFKDAVLSK